MFSKSNVSSWRSVFSFSVLFFCILFVSLSLNLKGSLALDKSDYFSDLDDTHKDFFAVESLAESGVVEGYEVESSEDGTSVREYKTDLPINRAEFSKIIVESRFGKEKSQEIKDEYSEVELKFPDVPDGVWYYPYIAYMSENGYIKGHADGTFRGADNINAVEALAIVTRVYGYGVDETSNPWWKNIAEKASELNIIHLDVEGPDDLVTRGQMAQIIYRMQAYENGDQTEKLGELANYHVTFETLESRKNLYLEIEEKCQGFVNCELEVEEETEDEEEELDNEDDSETETETESEDNVSSEGGLVKNIQVAETDEGVLVTWDGVGEEFFQENGYQGYKVFYAKKSVENFNPEYFYYYKVGKSNSAVISVFGEEGKPLEVGADYYFYVALFADGAGDSEEKESAWSGGLKLTVSKNFGGTSVSDETEDSTSDETETGSDN